MTHAADHHALRQFSKGNSPAAFEELVRVYADLVYTTARRIVGETHLAEDVTQATFIVLARKAHQIDPRTLPGWLVNTTRLAALAALRSQKVRSMHETKLAQLRATATASADEPTLTEFLPLLDEALSHLNDIDRTAVTLRFLQGIPFAEIAQTTGTTEEAARKRVSRAVEKLRTVFTKKGILPSTGGLMVLLATQQSQSAPVAVSKLALDAPMSGGTKSASVLAKGVLTAMNWTTTKTLAIILLLILIAGGTVGLHFMQHAYAQSPPSKATTTNTSEQPPDNKTDFDRIYVLSSDQVLLRLKPPFPDGRLDFYQLASPSQAESAPTGPDTMLLKWVDGKPAVRMMCFGTDLHNPERLFEVLLGVFPQEVEGDLSILNADLSGDFLYRPDAPAQKYLDALKTILSEASGSSIKLSLQDVDRDIFVLRGKWNYSAVDDVAKEHRTIEIYGRDLNTDRRGGGGIGDARDWAAYLGQYLNQQVSVQADGIPNQLFWSFNDAGDKSKESRDKAHNAELVLKHIQEQTGLTWSTERRKVRRLVVAK